MAASSTEQTTAPNSNPNDTRRNRRRPKTGARSSEYRANQREMAQKAKAEAEGRTYTKHEKTAQRTAEIIKKDADEWEGRQRTNNKNDVAELLTERLLDHYVIFLK